MNIKFYHFLHVSNNNRIDIMIKRNKNNEGKLIFPLKEESRSLVKRAGLKILQGEIPSFRGSWVRIPPPPPIKIQLNRKNLQNLHFDNPYTDTDHTA